MTKGRLGRPTFSSLSISIQDKSNKCIVEKSQRNAQWRKVNIDDQGQVRQTYYPLSKTNTNVSSTWQSKIEDLLFFNVNDGIRVFQDMAEFVFGLLSFVFWWFFCSRLLVWVLVLPLAVSVSLVPLKLKISKDTPLKGIINKNGWYWFKYKSRPQPQQNTSE